MRVYKDVTELIGNTPLLEAERFGKKMKSEAAILAKLESFNPAGSAKDRVAAGMIADAEERGLLAPGGVIVEPTSGNTGIGLACVASVKGYQVILTMPETMSLERRNLLKAYGAKLVLTEGSKGMTGAVEKARELVKETPGAWMPGQFENPANPKVHFETTGPEIWRDTEGQVDIFVAGVGTGGTLSGVGNYLKSQKDSIKIIAVEPAGSPLLSGGTAGSHGLQGIGANFIPENLDREIYDEVLAVTEEEAYKASRVFAGEEGILVGISAGAALHGAVQLGKRPENRGKRIVALLPDTGEHYFSTPLFEL